MAGDCSPPPGVLRTALVRALKQQVLARRSDREAAMAPGLLLESRSSLLLLFTA